MSRSQDTTDYSRFGEQPPELHIEDHGRALVITRKRSREQRGGAVVIALVSATITGYVFYKRYPIEEFSFGSVGPIAVSLIISLGLLYTMAVFLKNETTIVVDSESLSVGEGPLPWPGKLQVPIELITQIVTQKIEHRSKEHGTRYQLELQIRGHGRKQLLPGSQDRAPHRFLEQVLEDYMGIEDDFGKKRSRTRRVP